MKGNHIRLRAPEPDDIDILYRWENDPEIWRVSNTTAPFSRMAIEQYVLNAGQDIFSARQLRLMIISLEKGEKPVGAIDLFDFDPLNRRAGIGIMIDEPYRRKGYAAEALSLIIHYCKHTLNLHQVYCNISENNLPSIHLFEKTGFVKTGEKKEWLVQNGEWVNELFFQMLMK